MKKEFPLLVIITSCLFSQFFIIEGTASIKPVITTTMPKEMTIGLQEVTLHWYVIDDNLDSYVIYINNSLWKKGGITSNLLEVQFSNTIGPHNITLLINDFSNNSAAYQMVIIVTQSYPTTTPSTNSSNANLTTSYTTYASAGFTFVEALSLVICLVVLLKVAKLDQKKNR